MIFMRTVLLFVPNLNNGGYWSPSASLHRQGLMRQLSTPNTRCSLSPSLLNLLSHSICVHICRNANHYMQAVLLASRTAIKTSLDSLLHGRNLIFLPAAIKECIGFLGLPRQRTVSWVVTNNRHSFIPSSGGRQS